MPTINPYLNFPGNTEEAFKFYKSVFGGEFSSVVRFKDTPEASKVPAAEADKLMHISLPIGKHTVLMATDALESMGQKIRSGNNFHVSVNTETEEEARRIFDALSKDAQTVMVPLTKQFWGDLFGMFTDKFGTQWMVSYSDKAVSQKQAEEALKAAAN